MIGEPRYIDIHILQTVPPANVNRDDNGNPKEAIFGGVRRSRVSSQAWKRATRKGFSELRPEEAFGTRTKRIARNLADRLTARTPLAEAAAERLAAALLKPLGIAAGKRKAGETAYLLFYGRGQLENIVSLVADRAVELSEMDDEQLEREIKAFPVQEQLKQHHPMDVALFGRMVADIPALNVDAATQVAHALSTHAVELESDYYTAVDDQNEKDETGAGMIGSIGFNSATLYRYATVGLHQLAENLTERDKVIEAVGLFVDSFARSIPTGHENSFAHRTRPSLVAVVVRDDQPVNLVSAFEKPVSTPDGAGLVAASARTLAKEHRCAAEKWGDVPSLTAVCHTLGSDDEITRAFGVNQTFPELLSQLRDHLSVSWRQG